MAEFTKEEQVQAVYDLKVGYTLGHADIAMLKSMARQLLASMEQEPVFKINHESSLIKHVKKVVREASAPQPATAAPQLPQPAVVADIDARMKAAGMLSAVDIIAGQPIDAFVRHSGVVDMDSLLSWAEMRRTEFLRMQARYELGDKEKDELYEWVVSHVAVFGELHVNIRAAMLQGAEPVSQPYALRDGWVAVPVEPTAEMISSGIAAHYERSQIQINDRPAPGPMECAYMAMVAAAPQQEVNK